MLQLRIESFDNRRGLLADGRCCWHAGDGGRLTGRRGKPCAAVPPCRTFFTVCLTHHQRHNDTAALVAVDSSVFDAEDRCTFGHDTTSVHNRNSLDASESPTSPATLSLYFPFDFTWPVSTLTLYDFTWPVSTLTLYDFTWPVSTLTLYDFTWPVSTLTLYDFTWPVSTLTLYSATVTVVPARRRALAVNWWCDVLRLDVEYC